MFNIGDWLLSTFGPYGWPGILVFIFLVFYIDAIIFPTLPELFFIIGLMYDPNNWQWCIAVLLTAAAAEAAGISTLYYVVEHIRVPKKLKDLAEKYSRFMIVQDERMVIVNRFAPMIPFTGAFISLVPSWKLGRAVFYNIIGCFLKYGLITLFSSFFFAYFSGPDAQRMTIIFTIAIMVISVIVALLKKKYTPPKEGGKEERTEEEGEAA